MTDIKDELARLGLTYAYNKSNFRKLYQHYDKTEYKGELTKMNRRCKFSISNWHAHPFNDGISSAWIKGFGTLTTIPLYCMDGGSVVVYKLTSAQVALVMHTLRITDLYELLKYVVRNFIMDLTILAEREKYAGQDHMTVKQSLNTQGYTRLLPVRIRTWTSYDGTACQELLATLE